MALPLSWNTRQGKAICSQRTVSWEQYFLARCAFLSCILQCLKLENVQLLCICVCARVYECLWLGKCTVLAMPSPYGTVLPRGTGPEQLQCSDRASSHSQCSSSWNPAAMMQGSSPCSRLVVLQEEKNSWFWLAKMVNKWLQYKHEG